MDRLANDLKATGFEVWYDLSGLEAGTRWGQEIQKAIQASQFFLVVLSPNSIISDWVEREFLYASDQNLKIIPLLYQPCNLPMWSLNLHFIDMQGKNYVLHYQELLKIMGVKPELAEANPIAIRYIEIGDEYRKRGQASQAIESYLQALKVDPGNLKARSNIGAVHLMEQDYAQAAEAFELALQISGGDLVARAGFCDANLALGNQARAEGKIEEAIRYYLEINRLVPDDRVARQSLVNIYTTRAETLLSAGQDDEALIAFSEALKYSPDDPTLTSRLEKIRAGKTGRVLNELIARSEIEISAGNWEKAIAALNEALETAPQEGSILKKIGHIKAKQLQEQLEAILSKVDQAEKAGRWETALAGLNEYLQLKPDDTATKKRLVDLMDSKHAAWLSAISLRVDQALEKRNWDEALTALQEGLQIEPDNAGLKARAAQVQANRRTTQLKAICLRADQAAGAGRWEEAIEILTRGVSSYPEDGTLKNKLVEMRRSKQDSFHQVALHLADVATRAGQWETAQNLLNEVLAEEPDNVEFLQKLDQILRLERDSKLQALKTKAQDLLKAEKIDQALALWNEALTHETGNHQAVLDEIEAVIQIQKLASNYSAAEQAYAEKDYEKAVNLFKSILQEQAGYKDAAKLLTKSQKRLRPSGKVPRSSSRRIWLIGGFLVILALGIGALVFWFGENGLPADPGLVTKNTSTSTNNNIQIMNTPDPRKLNPANQHQYLFVDNDYSWQDARDDCAARGGYLVTIQDEAENQFINQFGFGSFWLGATDETEEGTWGWVTGEPWMYTNWAEGQPDNDITDDSSGENYLALLWPEAPSQWNDVPNGSGPFVCEWEPSLQGKTITVTSVEDSGTGTLRQALLDARAGDTIIFDPAVFPTEVPVAINLYSQLPILDQGYLTLDASNAGVVLNGSHIGGEWIAGIDVWSDHNVIKGLGVLNFSGPGIILQVNANFNTVGGDRGVGLGQVGEGNFFGANSDGIAIWGSDNVITGNLIGIIAADAEDWEVGNKASGVFISDNASRNTIGPNNIIAFNGSVGGCGIDYLSLDAKNNNITANIIYGNEPDTPGICYNINPGGQFVYSTPPAILYFELDSGSVAGQTCPYCLVEIFSTDTQDGKIYEGAVRADIYGNFTFRKGTPLAGPFLTATSRSAGENTSEISLPTAARTDIQIALDAAWVSAPLFQTSFNSWDFGDSNPNAMLENGKLIITSVNDEHTSVDMSKLQSDRFVAEFEFILSEASSQGHCVFETSNSDNGELSRGISVGFFTNSQTTLAHHVPPEDTVAIAMALYDDAKINKVTLIILGEQIAAFLNGQIAYATINPDESVVYTHQALTGTFTITCEYDNYKIWDLSGVDFNP